jgi:hypothetical protein
MKETTKNILTYGALIFPATILALAILLGMKRSQSLYDNADLARNKKYLDSKRAHANYLANKGDARSLTVAAMLLNSDVLLNPSTTNNNNALQSKWIAMAAIQAPEDPLIAWVETMQCFNSENCNPSNALERLEQRDSNNAAVHLLSFNQAKIDNDLAKMDAAFFKASNSRHFQWYYNKLGGMVYDALSDWRPDIHAFDRASDAKLLGLGRPVSDQDYRKFESLNMAITYMVPALQDIYDFCSVGAKDQKRLKGCIKFFGLMSNDKTTVSKAVGLTKLVKMTATLPEGAVYREELRQFYWARENYSKLNIGKPETESSFVRLWPEVTEWDAIVKDLNLFNIPSRAPQNWLPENESKRSLVLTGLDSKN